MIGPHTLLTLDVLGEERRRAREAATRWPRSVDQPATWTHRSLWRSILAGVLPESAPAEQPELAPIFCC